MKKVKTSARCSNLIKKKLGCSRHGNCSVRCWESPSVSAQQLVDQTQQMMQGSEMSFDKVTQFELLKHGQAMTGIVIHKAAQVVGLTLTLHSLKIQLTLRTVLTRQQKASWKGGRPLTGQEADQGLLHVLNAAAAAGCDW